MKKAAVVWAKAPVSAVWHRVRGVSEAHGLRDRMLHSACGLAFLSEQPLRPAHPKRAAVCGACITPVKVQ